MTSADDAPPRWGSSLAIVLGVHAAAIAGALWWQARVPAPLQAPMEAVMVELAPLAEAPPAPPTDLPPGPPQQEQHRPEPKPQPVPDPVQEPPPPVPPEVALPAPREPVRTDTEHTADAADVDQTSAPPSVQAPTGSRYAAQQSVTGVRSAEQMRWEGLLLGHLQRYKRYPRQAERRRVEGVAYVRLEVDRNGKVSNPRIGRSANHRLLDDEAVAVVLRASPVPPPPPEIPGDPVEVMVPVEFFLRR